MSDFMLTPTHRATADEDMDGGIADAEMHDAIDATIEADAGNDDKKSEVSSAVGMTSSRPKAKVVKAKSKSKASTPGAEVKVEVPAKK